MKRWLYGLLFLALAGMASAVAAQQGQPAYEDVTQQAGIQASRTNETEKMIGQAWGDYDQDGWLDLYLTNPHGENWLYHNNGDGTFALSPFQSTVALPSAMSGGATFADYDNDGWPDLYVVNWGPNVLFHNEQGQGFTDVTEKAGVGNPDNGKSAAWGDFNQDGRLDLYIANWSCYPQCGRPSEGDRDRLFANNGDGTFSDMTNVLGSGTRGAGFAASFIDYDNDDDLDIYLVNDEFINPIGNVLWRNDGPGCDGWCFTNVAKESGTNTEVMGMGLAVGDYNNDGFFDFYFSNAGPMTLLQNKGDGTFTDMAPAAAVDYPADAWGAVFLDYNNDGWRDLYLAVMQGHDEANAGNPLFQNNGNGTFTNLGATSGAADEGATLGVASADYDHDGWTDLVVGNFDTGYKLYRNLGASTIGNLWVTFRLVGKSPVNRDAVGAKVYVTDSNGRTQVQQVMNGSSLGAGNALELYFGLGNAEIQRVQVRWPDGTDEYLGTMPYNQRYTLVYGEIGANEPLPTPETAVAPQPVATPLASHLLLWASFAIGLLVLGSTTYLVTWLNRKK